MLSPHVVRQGDYLTKLAALRGFSAEDVWNDPKNEPLRRVRDNMDVLLPGDVVWIPEPEPQPLPLARGAENRYVSPCGEITVSVILRDGDRPLSGEPFEARLPGGPVVDAANGQGRISFGVPAYLDRVDVFLPRRNEILPLLIGHLDPPNSRSGAASRLASLGYFGDSWDEALLRDDDALRGALAAFQKDHGEDFGLSPTGTLDAGTSKALVAVHGS